ncbi:hypothetical protein L1887_53670 [Cichorium endivia]|nr:hypothetical protein L1887_53670 [Cichorium endivia]
MHRHDAAGCTAGSIHRCLPFASNSRALGEDSSKRCGGAHEVENDTHASRGAIACDVDLHSRDGPATAPPAPLIILYSQRYGLAWSDDVGGGQSAAYVGSTLGSTTQCSCSGALRHTHTHAHTAVLAGGFVRSDMPIRIPSQCSAE